MSPRAGASRPPTLQEVAAKLRLPPGRGTALGRLRHLSECLRVELEEWQAGHTAAAERDTLRRAAHHLRAAAGALAELSPGARSHVMGTLAWQADPGTAAVYDLAAAELVLNVPALRAWAAALDAVREPIEAVIDRGRGNLHDRLYGDPRQDLARGCVALIREARETPNVTRTLNLMAIVWEHATGRAPNRRELDRYARRAIVTL